MSRRDHGPRFASNGNREPTHGREALLKEEKLSSGLSDHVALVTGGVRGIGLAISELLIAQGARVAAGYSRNGEAAEAFLEKYADHGVSVHQGTIEDHADCERVVEEVVERHGRLDILVNNAGITMDHTVRKMLPEEWERVIGVNLGAPSTCAERRFHT